MKSIIPGDEPNVCFLCGIQNIYTEVHHALHGTANRKLADADGLTVHLCMNCHRKLHDQGFGDRYLQEIAEEAWLKVYRGSITDFVKRYGKNFIYESDSKDSTPAGCSEADQGSA